MATAGQLRRRLKAHSLQIIPASRIVGHRDVVLISKDDACAFEELGRSRDRALRATSGLVHHIGAPSTAATSSVVISLHGAREHGGGVLPGPRRARAPLVAGPGVDGRFLLSVRDHKLGYVLEGRNRSRSLSSRALPQSGRRPWRSAPMLCGLRTRRLQADVRI